MVTSNNTHGIVDSGISGAESAYRKHTPRPVVQSSKKAKNFFDIEFEFQKAGVNAKKNVVITPPKRKIKLPNAKTILAFSMDYKKQSQKKIYAGRTLKELVKNGMTAEPQIGIPGAQTMATLGQFMTSLDDITADINESELVSKLNTVSDKVSAFIDEATDTNAALRNALSDARDILSQIQGETENPNIKKVQSLLDRAEGISNSTEDTTLAYRRAAFVAGCASLAGATSMFMWTFDKKYLIIALVSAIVIACCNKSMMSTVWSHAASLFTCWKSADSAQPQMGIDDGITSALLLLYGILSNKKCTSVPILLLSMLDKFDRQKKTFSDLMDFFLRCMQKITDFVCRKGFGISSPQFFRSGRDDVDEYIRRARDVFGDSEMGQFDFTFDNYNKLKDLIVDGEDFLMKIPRDNASSAFVRAMSDAVNGLKNIMHSFASSGFATEGLRIEPTGLLVKGNPATGKSGVLSHLNHAINGYLCQDKEWELFKKKPDAFVHNRQFESQYWESYSTRNRIVFFDDLAQNKDVAGNPDNEYLNIIRAINEFQYSLHMAGLDRKGNTNFTSEFVIATSNLDKIKPASIISAAALMRRFDIVVIVCPKAQYCTKETLNNVLMERSIDFSKLPIGEDGVSSLQPDILEFHLVLNAGKDNETTSPTPIEFEDLVEMLLERHALKKKWYLQKQKELKHRSEEWHRKAEERRRRDNPYYDAEKKLKEEEALKNAVPQGRFADVMKLAGSNLNSYTWQFLVDPSSMAIRNMILADPNLSDPFLKVLSKFNDLHPESYRGDIDGFITNICLQVGAEELARILDEQDWEELSKRMETLTNDVWVPTRVRVQFPFFRKLAEEFSAYTMRLAQSMIGKDGKPSVAFHCVMFFLNFGVLYATYKVFKWVIIKLIGLKEGVVSIFSPNDSSAPSPIKLEEMAPDAKIADMKVALRSAVPQMAASADPNGNAIVNKILKLNTYEMCRISEFTENIYGYVTFIKGRVAIMPRHFILYFVSEYNLDEKDRMVTFRQQAKGGPVERFKIDLRDLVEGAVDMKTDTPMDMIAVEFPSFVRNHGNIIKFFPTNNVIKNDNDVQFVLRFPEIAQKESCGGQAKKLTREITVKSTRLPEYKIVRGFEYTATTTVGDCGALFTIVNRSDPTHKIWGIHIAGFPEFNRGIAAVVTQEEINASIAEIQVQSLIDEPIEAVAQIGLVDPIGFSNAQLKNPNMVSLFEVSKTPSVGSKSSIIPSRLYNEVWKSEKMPAMLHSKMTISGFINPHEIATSRYCTGSNDVDPVIMQACANNYFTDMAKDSINVPREIYSFEEAVLGIPGDNDFKSIPRDTSAGYPKSMERHGDYKGKEWWFGKEMHYDLTGPAALALKQEVEDIIDNASKGVRQFHVFTDFLKDELRSKQKAASGNTRLISASSLALTIAYRRYFGAFMRWYTKNRINNGSAIGVNPFGMEWHMIGTKMTNHSPLGSRRSGAGDYVAYDGKHPKIGHSVMIKEINNWYNGTDTESLVRHVLWLELTNSRHIVGSLIYEWLGSLPSGHPLTSIVNTILNNILFRYAYVSFNDMNLSSLEKFSKNIFLICQGDDNAFSVAESDPFNELDLSIHLARIGMEYTAEDKERPLVRDLRDLHEITFLKRRFIFNKETQRFVAPLEIKVIHETINWTKDCADQDQIVEDKVYNAIMELALHGKEIFYRDTTLIIDAYNKHYNRELPYPNWDLEMSKVQTHIARWLF